MAGEEDPESKTEEPTARRIDEFRKRGELAFSRDVMAFSGVMAGVLSLVIVGTFVVEHFAELWRALMRLAQETPPPGANRIRPGIVWEALKFMALVLAAPMGLTVAVSLLTGFAQTRGNLSWEPLTPKPEKLNPFPNLKRLFFSTRALVDLARNAFKVGVLASVAWMVLSKRATDLLQLPHLSLKASLSVAGDVLLRLMGSLGFAMLIFAALDLAWQKYQMNQKMKMSRQELKDEHKDVEGDPLLRGARRQRMREMAAARGQVQAAKEATVIVVNPTHVAVALRYDPSKGDVAPRVLCKGLDQVAAEIREVGRKAGVPIIQRRALARLLYKTAKPGREIPVELYEAVASVLALVMRQKQPRAR